MQGNADVVRRVFFFVDLESEDELKSLRDLPAIRERIQFEHVDFNYPNGHPALSDINLELQVDELIAIVRSTGAGKTSRRTARLRSNLGTAT